MTAGVVILENRMILFAVPVVNITEAKHLNPYL